MIPAHLQTRLNQVDPQSLSGRTPDRFRQVFQQTGLYWRDVIQAYADAGLRWKDVARVYGIKDEALRAYCKRRNLVFPFQGKDSPEARQARSERQLGKVFYRPPMRQFTAFGTTADLDTLIQRHGHESMNKITAYCRIRRGWSIETALTLPRGQKSGLGSPRRKAA